MDTKTRAEKIWAMWYELPKIGPEKFKEFITSQLDEAIKDATELDFSKWPDLEARLEGIAESANRGQSKHAVKVVLRTLVDQAVREAVKGRFSYRLGFAAAREKAAGIVGDYTSNYFPGQTEMALTLRDRILAMQPDGK